LIAKSLPSKMRFLLVPKLAFWTGIFF